MTEKTVGTNPLTRREPSGEKISTVSDQTNETHLLMLVRFWQYNISRENEI